MLRMGGAFKYILAHVQIQCPVASQELNKTYMELQTGIHVLSACIDGNIQDILTSWAWWYQKSRGQLPVFLDLSSMCFQVLPTIPQDIYIYMHGSLPVCVSRFFPQFHGNSVHGWLTSWRNRASSPRPWLSPAILSTSLSWLYNSVTWKLPISWQRRQRYEFFAKGGLEYE